MSKTVVNIKEYYDKAYKDVGGLKGLLDKRRQAGIDQQITNDMYPDEMQKYMTNSEGANYGKTILNNPNAEVSVDYGGNDELLDKQEGTAQYSPQTRSILLHGKILPDNIRIVGRHEMLHGVQHLTNEDEFESLLAEPAKYREKTGNTPAYAQMRPELDAHISQVLQDYASRGKYIINEKDADEVWDDFSNKYSNVDLSFKLKPDGSKEDILLRIMRHFKKAGLTKEHFRKLAPRLVENKIDKPANSKILRDPNYA